MYDSAKYLIHADIRASGVVERSDVVGAVFGQTEGLLGDGLDLRDLQESGKLGRIDVEIESERGSSFGEITIASGLDRVETAILAAALESIDRVGPCRADIEVSEIEDVRTAKRRQIVDRAKELLAEFDETALTSDEIVEEVRRSVRVEDITEFHGLPAGPRVGDSDAVVVVEGRADVLTLLRYGVKNAIAVEGTDVPDAVADLTSDRTVTAFLDGDRGGDLILKELEQVGNVDYVALAPPDRSVEDLSRDEALQALREKVPFETVSEDPVNSRESADDGEQADSAADDGESAGREPAAADGSVRPVPDEGDSPKVDGKAAVGSATSPDHEVAVGRESDTGRDVEGTLESAAVDRTETAMPPTETGGDETDAGDGGSDDAPGTLVDHVEAVLGDDSEGTRLLDGDGGILAEGSAADAFDLVESAEEVPRTVVVDGAVTQRLLDVTAQRGVERVVGREEGEYVKQPTAVRVHTADELRTADGH